MNHRHLQYPPGTPVDDLPSVALVDLLERGDLEQWRPIAVAIARAPFGPLARKLADLLDAFPMYGTSPLWRSWIGRCRAREEGRRQSGRTVTLTSLRRGAGLTQVELARRLEMSQSDLSKLERRSDLRLSTLRKFAEALGGRLRIVFDRAGESVGVQIRGTGSTR